MARRKAESVHVPAGEDEARQMAAEYVAIDRRIMLERLAAEDAIDRVKAQRDAAIAALHAEAQPLFAGLKAWWEAGGAAVLAGRRRSAELGGATLGIRKTPPAVKFARGVKAGDVIAFLKGLRWTRAAEFLRTKTDLDRQALIKAVQADPAVADAFHGQLTVEQADEFFIDTGLEEEALRKEIA